MLYYGTEEVCFIKFYLVILDTTVGPPCPGYCVGFPKTMDATVS
jgi:hypothetical protein